MASLVCGADLIICCDDVTAISLIIIIIGYQSPPAHSGKSFVARTKCDFAFIARVPSCARHAAGFIGLNSSNIPSRSAESGGCFTMIPNVTHVYGWCSSMGMDLRCSSTISSSLALSFLIALINSTSCPDSFATQIPMDFTASQPLVYGNEWCLKLVQVVTDCVAGTSNNPANSDIRDKFC